MNKPQMLHQFVFSQKAIWASVVASRHGATVEFGCLGVGVGVTLEIGFARVGLEAVVAGEAEGGGWWDVVFGWGRCVVALGWW